MPLPRWYCRGTASEGGATRDSVGIAIWQRLFLHRFPASEGLPGFLSLRAIARRICLQRSVMVCRSRPWKPSPANWIISPRKLGCCWESRSAASPGGARPSSSTAPELRRVQLMQLWRIAREVHTRQARPKDPLSRSPVMEHYWRHWLGWASSRPPALAPVAYSAARACIPHTNIDS